MNFKIKLVDGGKLPVFKHDGDACADCYARIPNGNMFIHQGGRALIPLGFALGLDKGWEAQIRPRSGLSSKGIDVSFGTVDSGYRAEIMACVKNNSGSGFYVSDGDRICQIAVREVPKVCFEQVSELDETERGENGFGSTGIR